MLQKHSVDSDIAIRRRAWRGEECRTDRRRRKSAGRILTLVVAVSFSAVACSRDDGVANRQAAAAADPAAAAESTSMTRIYGKLGYLQRIALPEGAYAMVEVRNSAGPDAAPVVAEKRIDLNGAQPPIPFELDVDRMRLPMDIGLAFRAGIFVDGAPKFVSALIPVNLTLAEVDMGDLVLQPFRAEPFASDLACGDRLVRLSATDAGMQLNVDGVIHPLKQVEAASGAKYEAADDPGIVFWNKEDDTSLSIGGGPLEPCRLLRGGPNLAALLVPGFRARGQEPPWQLTLGDGEMTLSTGYTSEAATFSASAPAIDGRRAVVTSSEGPRVVIDARPCQDTMSGVFYPAAVTVQRDGETLRGCGGEPGDLLTANEWIVEDIDGGGIIDRSRISLLFAPDGRVSGLASCNSFSGSWSVSGEGMSFGNAAVTQKACAPSLMDQEIKFLDIMRAVSGFRISNTGALVLETPDGRSLTARDAG